ncbi:RRS1 [Candida pseudojiufengensis]|uniref:RRS1 n=1 Tax=Candida pseudojiufengensis TaxID=497109 RepID=UPI0022253A11|nr:RRS1 [Candida pseudojiufengensis]KAI5961180.1 RRS1 [Candida pseudojiufengensis]
MSKEDYKPVTVEKLIENTYDLGNLATFDPNPLSNEKLTSKNESEKEQYISSITRDNVQLLINQILSLPVKTTTDNQGSSTGQTSSMTLIQLPEPTTPLPREKGIPKDKPKTKWEEFAARKGIKAKTKNEKLEYDEEKGEWVNKWGYKGNNKKLDDQWLVEVNDEDNSKKRKRNEGDELIDPRTLARSERKKLIKKNELQHKRNLKNGSK